MPKYSVQVHGQHYKGQFEKRDWLFRRRPVMKWVGFYTTRFIETDSENPREIAALAGALRSLTVYETGVPACKHTGTGNLPDHAFWGCIKKTKLGSNGK
jgi:hypothetical protein